MAAKATLGKACWRSNALKAFPDVARKSNHLSHGADYAGSQTGT